jgi:hypothetical protein
MGKLERHNWAGKWLPENIHWGKEGLSFSFIPLLVITHKERSLVYQTGRAERKRRPSDEQAPLLSMTSWGVMSDLVFRVYSRLAVLIPSALCYMERAISVPMPRVKRE